MATQRALYLNGLSLAITTAQLPRLRMLSAPPRTAPVPRQSQYLPEFRERAVKMVIDVRSSFESDEDAVNAVAGILDIDNPDVLRKWLRRDRRGAAAGSPGTSWLGSLKRFATRSHAIVIGVVITVLGGLGLAYSLQVTGVGHSVSADSGPHLEVDQVTLTYGSEPRATAADPYGGPWPPIPPPFEIDIRLLNTGPQVAAINSARLVMQQFASLPECMAQGGFAPSGSYSASLPDHASPGRTIDIPISQLVPANGADRFDLLLRSQLPGNALADLYLYRFHLYLFYSTRDRLDLGEITISFPSAPAVGSYFWSETVLTNPSLHTLLIQLGRAGIEKCDIQNSRTLHSILSLPGARPAKLAAIPPQLKY
jgi:transposase-like protein